MKKYEIPQMIDKIALRNKEDGFEAKYVFRRK